MVDQVRRVASRSIILVHYGIKTGHNTEDEVSFAQTFLGSLVLSSFIVKDQSYSLDSTHPSHSTARRSIVRYERKTF